jgi:hypothetical protein
LDTVGDQKRIQTDVCAKSSLDSSPSILKDSSRGVKRQTRDYTEGSRISSAKKSVHRALSPLHAGVLQFNLCDTKEELRKDAASDKPQASEQDAGKVSLQDGDYQVDHSSSTTRRLDSLCRPDRRILSCADAQKYLHFTHGKRVFQFVALPFGLAPAPYVFTRLMTTVGQATHKCMLHLFLYLDDSLMRNAVRRALLRQVPVLLVIFDYLGFLRNEGKSDLVPSQRFVFLGILYVLLLAVALIPGDRWLRLKSTISAMLKHRRSKGVVCGVRHLNVRSGGSRKTSPEEA